MPSEDIFSLKGRVALVTGGGTGIGRAIAHALSDHGAELVLVGRRLSVLDDALAGRSGMTCPLDLLEESAADGVFGFCIEKGIRPDILVNAAGVNPRQHADNISSDVWYSTIHLNLSVPFLVAQKLTPAMAERNWGRIINIASLQSERAFENGIAYGASKGGIVQLTRAMAEAWSGRGITANAIAPGFFPTDLTAPVFNDPHAANALAAKTAIGRNGDLADLRGPAVFLASDASAYVTGQTLFVDGGFTAK